NPRTRQPTNPVLANTFPVGIEHGDLLAGQKAKHVVHQGQPDFGAAAAPMGQQLEEEWNGDTTPQDSQHQCVHICLTQLPIRAVNDKFSLPGIRKQPQHDSGKISWAQGMAVEKPLNSANDRGRPCASREALSQFCMPDVLGLKECQDDERKQLHLVFAVLREMSTKAARQMGQRGRGALPDQAGSQPILTLPALILTGRRESSSCRFTRFSRYLDQLF
ncbi:hypothetical protein, partial [Deinococcus aquatilis]|uniref:hypothetical protein n=1 Tax=Deinococcus aquatilis TaxID=519440 RepID=UPI001B7FEE96